MRRTDWSKAIDWALVIAVYVVLIVALAGCRSVEYSNANTGTTVRYVNVGFNTAIGKLSIPTANGVAELEGLDSKQEVTRDLADTAREAIRRVPVPGSASPYSAPADPTPATVSVPALTAPAIVTAPVTVIPPAGKD